METQNQAWKKLVKISNSLFIPDLVHLSHPQLINIRDPLDTVTGDEDQYNDQADMGKSHLLLVNKPSNCFLGRVEA